VLALQSVPHRKHYVSTTKPNRLMLCGETVAVYCENRTELNERCIILYVKAGGIYNSHTISKGCMKHPRANLKEMFPIVRVEADGSCNYRQMPPYASFCDVSQLPSSPTNSLFCCKSDSSMNGVLTTSAMHVKWLLYVPPALSKKNSTISHAASLCGACNMFCNAHRDCTQ
jgi:hypothetical protein